jgi:hypothetical protein
VLAAWLLTRIPYAPLTGEGRLIGLAEGLDAALGDALAGGRVEAVGVAEDDGERLAVLLAGPPPQAARIAAATRSPQVLGVETRGSVPIRKDKHDFAVGVTFPVRSTL